MNCDPIPSLVIQGLLAEIDTRDSAMARQHAQIVDLVADTDSLRETLSAALDRLHSTTGALAAATRAVKALRAELSRYTIGQVSA
jgi:hypothetical protein